MSSNLVVELNLCKVVKMVVKMTGIRKIGFSDSQRDYWLIKYPRIH